MPRLIGLDEVQRGKGQRFWTVVRCCARRGVRLGVVESIKTTIKAVLRRARGTRDEHMLRLKLTWATAHPIRSARDLVDFLTAHAVGRETFVSR